MGNWNITIRGVGAHHNKKNESDANRMTAIFVKKLKEAGHSIQSATITHGGEDDLTDADKYLSDRDKIEE
jgi:hypothetical protein